LIKTGGINVSPADVEEVLMSHPDVQQVVVVGLPDAAREEIVAALVVARPGVVLDSQVLLAHCRQTAASFKVPRFLVVGEVADIPLTDTGKVHRGRTTELMAQRYAADALETSRSG
jgi:fatty-acyl-CoA synthase